MTAHRMPWCATRPAQRRDRHWLPSPSPRPRSWAGAGHTSRALNREFEDKLAMTVMRRIFSKLFLPAPITTAMACTAP